MNPVVDSLIGGCLAAVRDYRARLKTAPFFMMSDRCRPWSWSRPRSSSGLPSTAMRSASAPGAIVPEPARLSQDLRVDERGRTNTAQRLLHPRADLQLLGLVSVKLSQQVGAKTQFDARLQGDLDALQPSRQHRLEFRDAERRQLGARRLPPHNLVRDEGRHEIAAALRQQFGSRSIDQISVLDGPNPRLRGAGNRRRRVRMRGDIGVPTPRLVDDRFQLLIRVLRGSERDLKVIPRHRTETP